jgi:hypothetical protein
LCEIPAPKASDVNKDSRRKAKDSGRKAKAKDSSLKAKDSSRKAKAEELHLVLKGQGPRTNII